MHTTSLALEMSTSSLSEIYLDFNEYSMRMAMVAWVWTVNSGGLKNKLHECFNHYWLLYKMSKKKLEENISMQTIFRHMSPNLYFKSKENIAQDCMAYS